MAVSDLPKLNMKKRNFSPDFNQLLKVLSREIPSRPTLFEFALNDRIIGRLSGEVEEDNSSRLAPFHRLIKAFTAAGYDYTTISAWRTNTLLFPNSSYLSSLSTAN